jgi:hypothetical protein
MRFLGGRLGASLADPADRALLAWPTVLGAPKVRQDHPGGLPLEDLLAQAAPMLAALAVDPAQAWASALARFPDTADKGPTGWVPHRLWDPLASLVSLRCGVTLLALLGLPEDRRYPLAAGVSLFNAALFHESHDALEPLWLGAEGPEKAALQGLIMMAGGFHHQQLENAPGMAGLWEDAQDALEGAGTSLGTAWGTVRFGAALKSVADRLEALKDEDGERFAEPPWDRLWKLERPEWELT